MSHLDPRYFQIGVLGSLLMYGVTILGFDAGLLPIAIILTSSLALQYLFTRAVGLVRFDGKSALISALSLCLLFRASNLGVLLLGVFLTIGSKFLLRYRDRHLFNPTNFGIVATILLTGEAWVSPGQWGSQLFFASAVASLGMVVVNRAARSDVTFAFLMFYAGSLFLRAYWLGDPWSIPLHQLESGALIIFAFFMISDPKTTPDTRFGRIVFAALVAGVAYYFRFKLFEPNALLYSLVLCSLAVPIMNLLSRGDRYDWGAPSSGPFFRRYLQPAMNTGALSL